MCDNGIGSFFAGEPLEGGISLMLSDAEILEAIRRKRENLEWVSGAISSLRKDYGGRYIAVQDRKVVDSDEDFERLLARVRTRDDADSVTIEHVTEMEYLWIL